MPGKTLLHIIDSIEIAGAEKLLCNTITDLPEYRHVVVTLFPSGGLSLLPADTTYFFLGARKITDLPLKANRFRKIIREVKPALVHSHLYFSTVFAKWLTPRSIPFVFTQHFEFSKNATKWYYPFTENLVSSKRHHCIAVSNAVLRDYVNSTSFKGPSHVLSNYVPEKYFAIQKTSSLPRKGLRLVAVGNIKSIKNQRFILDAFACIKDLDVCCDIYGEGPDKQALAQEAQERGVKVAFKGSVDDSSLILGNYDIFIMPSLTEGFPLALFEAMASGLPVIVSDLPVFHEVLDNEGNYIPLDHPSYLRSIVERYLEKPQLLLDDGNKMKQLARLKAGKGVYLQKLRAIYTSLFIKH